MAEFIIGKEIETTEPVIEVSASPDNPLPVGKHVFQLVVEDDSGNASLPDTVEVIVRDTQAPTAVIKAPAQVEAGISVTLDGRSSSDVVPGKVVKYIWTKVQ